MVVLVSLPHRDHPGRVRSDLQRLGRRVAGERGVGEGRALGVLHREGRSRGGEEPVALLQPRVEERDGAPGTLGLHGDLGGTLPGGREVVDGERSELSIGIGDLGGERLHEHGGDVAAVRAALDPPPGDRSAPRTCRHRSRRRRCRGRSG